jgi:hypothetical protein
MWTDNHLPAKESSEKLIVHIHTKLLEDYKIVREAFILEEIASYIKSETLSNGDVILDWNKDVKVRLQEKKDWEAKFKADLLDWVNKPRLPSLHDCIPAESIRDFITNYGRGR